MVAKHKKIRLTMILMISTLFILPLLSSPTAALIIHNAGSGTSTNIGPPSAPTVVITLIPGTYPGGTPPGGNSPLDESFSYTFTDSNPGAKGSDHRCDMSISRTPGGAGPWSTTTGWVHVNSGGTTSGTLTITGMGFTPPVPPATVVFTITVAMTVRDLNLGGGITSGVAWTTVTIT